MLICAIPNNKYYFFFSDENDVSFVHGLGVSGTRDPQYILG